MSRREGFGRWIGSEDRERQEEFIIRQYFLYHENLRRSEQQLVVTNFTLLTLNLVLIMFVLAIPNFSLLADSVVGLIGILLCTFWIAHLINYERIIRERLSLLLEVELQLVEDGPVSLEWRISKGIFTPFSRLAIRFLLFAFIISYMSIPLLSFLRMELS